MKLNIIIPMAGMSSRFNYKFKPFLYLDNRCFIEHTLEHFIKYNNIIESYNFIVTEKQEKDNDVTKTLKTKLFNNISNKINIITIKETTSGPYQTLQKAFNSKLNTMKNVIICDSDHSINFEPILEKIDENVDIVIPLFNINYDEHHNWGKVVLNNNKILRFCEKEYVPKIDNQEVKGLIGCYYFKETKLLPSNNEFINISDYLHNNFKNLNIKFAVIKNAYFFGTPEMVKKCINHRRKYETILCDVDGVLLKHNSHSNDLLNNNSILGNCVKKIKEWRDNNKKIILITARPKNTLITFKKLLEELDIKYDDIIMGLNPGPRYLINDIKPSHPFVKQSVSFNITRDYGINNISCNESQNYNIEIKQIFKGNSFSNTYLLKNKENYFVRKYIIKQKNTLEHIYKLKRQCEDLKRFYYYDNSLVPQVLNEIETDYDYYIDIAYLLYHKQLDEYNNETQINVLKEILEKLKNNVYCYKKKNTNTNFIDSFFETKIYPKLKQFENECEIMNYLINNEQVIINNIKYCGLRNIFNKLNIHNFNTEWINPIHGDLTLENILYDINLKDIKLIDMDGSRYVDSCYFDLGKIFQSIVSNYKEWNILEEVIYDTNINNLKCIDKYFNCNNEDYKIICKIFSDIMEIDDIQIIYNKGIFFMSTYFIRFVQFRRKISKEHGIFAIIMAVVWLNKISL